MCVGIRDCILIIFLQKKIFRSLLSEMRVFTTGAQKDCNMCKNLAHAVFVSPDQVATYN